MRSALELHAVTIFRFLTVGPAPWNLKLEICGFLGAWDLFFGAFHEVSTEHPQPNI
jgi:hypothetical protein